jgi:hypothetical protein
MRKLLWQTRKWTYRLVRMKFDNEYAKFMNIDDNVVTSTSG